MPKSGGWMTEVKKILGVVLLALAAYYLRGFLGEKVYLIILGGLLMYIAMYINPFTGKTGISSWLGALLRTAAFILLVIGLVYISKGAGLLPGAGLQQREAPELSWQEFSGELLRQAATETRPVLIDFESKVWCAACREMEEKTFSNPEVQEVLSGFVLLKVDVDHHPQKEQLLEQYQVRGIPTLIVLNSQGDEVDRIAGFLKPEKFIPRIIKSTAGVM
jgi:thiol:disulfide interchange protein DsbD